MIIAQLFSVFGVRAGNMKDQRQNDSGKLPAGRPDRGPVWDLLKHSVEVRVSPFFARNVMREVRHLEDRKQQIRKQQDRKNRDGRDIFGIFPAIRDALRSRPGLVMAGLAMIFALLLLGFSLDFKFWNGDGAAVPLAGADVENLLDTGKGDSPESEFNPAGEMGTVEYLGQLMVVADPGQLSDDALADLLF